MQSDSRSQREWQSPLGGEGGGEGAGVGVGGGEGAGVGVGLTGVGLGGVGLGLGLEPSVRQILQPLLTTDPSEFHVREPV